MKSPGLNNKSVTSKIIKYIEGVTGQSILHRRLITVAVPTSVCNYQNLYHISNYSFRTWEIYSEVD